MIYLGDSQSNPETVYDYSAWGALLKTVVSSAPESAAVIIGGDLINEETDDQEWNAFVEASDGMFEQIPLRPVSGNHTEDAARWTEFADTPQNGPAGYERVFYSFDAGPMHFLMLDSITMGSQDEAVQKTVRDWIREDLQSTECPWKIAVMHHPLYPLNQTNKDQQRAETMQEQYLETLENGGVRLVLCGHQHVYGRTVPMYHGEIADALHEKDGMVEIMGVSGGKFYGTEAKPFIAAYYDAGAVYTLLSAESDVLKINTLDAAGNQVDSIQLEK